MALGEAKKNTDSIPEPKKIKEDEKLRGGAKKKTYCRDIQKL